MILFTNKFQIFFFFFSQIYSHLESEIRKNKKNRNEDLIIFKLEIKKMCEDSEMDWRLALGDFESNSRMIEKEKEKEKHHELNFFQNSEKKKIMNNHYISDEKENINTKIDGRILVMNKDIQVSFSKKKLCFVFF